jgi:hypothetical protein
MKRVLILLALVVLSTAGCNDSTSPEQITIGDLAGTWTATSFVYTSTVDAADQWDLVASGGSLTMVITAAGAFTGTTVLPSTVVETYTGTMSVSGSRLTQDFDEEGIPTLIWTIGDYTNDSMTLSGGLSPFDFTDDGSDDYVSASIRTTIVRQ